MKQVLIDLIKRVKQSNQEQFKAVSRYNRFCHEKKEIINDLDIEPMKKQALLKITEEEKKLCKELHKSNSEVIQECSAQIKKLEEEE